MSKFERIHRVTLTVIALVMIVAISKLQRIKMEVEHIAKNAKSWQGGPVRTLKQEKEYYEKLLED